jgi:hypothetical protein
MKSVLLFLGLVLAAPRAQALLPVIDANLFYFSDGMVYSSATSAYNRTFWDFMIGMPTSSKGYWVIGWNYDTYSFIDNPGTATKLSITDMGPKILYAINKDKTFVFAFNYNLITKGSYSPGGGTTSELRGTSMRVELGYTPAVSENCFMGPKLNYYKATFTEEITGQTALAKVTDSRTVIYPSFTITYRFD